MDMEERVATAEAASRSVDTSNFMTCITFYCAGPLMG